MALCCTRAEDGRAIESVDISPFIDNLPYGKSTTNFSTTDASGSTSQAANIMESLEVGARVLLVDEDTAATNFMIRSAAMQRLVAPDKEPITPFIAKVRPLAETGPEGGNGATAMIIPACSTSCATTAAVIILGFDDFNTRSESIYD